MFALFGEVCGRANPAANLPLVSALTTFSTRFTRSLRIICKISTALLAAFVGFSRLLAAAAVSAGLLSALTASFSRPIGIILEAATGLLATASAGLGCPLRIVLEITTKLLSAFTGDFPLFVIIHRCKSAARTATLLFAIILVWHNFPPLVSG